MDKEASPTVGVLRSIHGTAQHLKVSDMTIRRLLSSGQLRAIRLSKTLVRISDTDLQAFLQSKAA